MSALLDSYTQYTTPKAIQDSLSKDNQLGNVGSSISISVTYSASWSWTVTWTVG
ncbi:signal protein [Streptococcus dentapri]|uniref:Signal protein n=1 Tax=Streptococcus dentapri TaxID=573564 RepID=A0ABV8CYT5_9STRE